MSQWYYARDGQRHGPVDRASLEVLAGTGGLSPDDLVWTEGMGDWQPARSVEGLFGSPPVAGAAVPPSPVSLEPTDPYASPASMTEQPPAVVTGGSGDLPVLDPSATLSVGGPIQLATEILKKDFGMILAAGLVYFGVLFGVSMVFQVVGVAIQLASGSAPRPAGNPADIEALLNQGPGIVFTVFSNLVQQIVGTFMALGLTRVGMDVVEGRPVQIPALFSQASKLVGAFVGSLLLSLMAFGPAMLAIIPGVIVGMDGNTEVMAVLLVVGVLLLLFPGCYLAARFGFFQIAMVDRGMGMVDAFGESSRLTHGNKWVIILLYIVLMLINIAGLLVLCVGLLFTIPLTTLAWYVAYKWMLHGPEPLQRIHQPALAAHGGGPTSGYTR